MMLNVREEVNGILNNFIREQVWDLEEEGGMALEYCEMENDYHMTSYWLQYPEDVKEFLIDQFRNNKENFNILCDEIISQYPYKLEDLRKKIGEENFNHKANLAYHCLNTILLKNFQRTSVWYTVYGCEENDHLDFGKYNIVDALRDDLEFPVMKMEDVAAAMIGVNTTVQNSSLYDIFAHRVEELKEKEEESIIGIFETEKESIFTPDTFQYEGVVSRFKHWNKVKNTIKKGKNPTLIDYLVKLKECEILSTLGISPNIHLKDFIKEEYLSKYSRAPYGYPLTDKNISVELEEREGKEVFRATFKIMGIQNCKTVWKEIYDKTFDIPQTANDLQNFIIELAIYIKKELAGMEKVRGKDIAAIEGLFPRKNLATHGLKLRNYHMDLRKQEDITLKIPLEWAEKQALYVIQKALRVTDKPVISCSFGIDSVLVLHLIRRITPNIKVLFNNTGVEYGETIKLRNKLLKEWNIDLIEAKPETTYWAFQNEYGWNFERKGSRKNGGSNSEKCCQLLKHIPTKKALKEHDIDCTFTGLRGYESQSRNQSGKRDGVAYTSLDWGTLRVNPVLFFNNKMVWDYVKKHDVPYSEVYDKKLYDENDKLIYAPRTGCWCCMVTSGKGYLRWMKEFRPKQYMFLMKNKGLAEQLYKKSLGIDVSKSQKNDEKPQQQLSVFDTVFKETTTEKTPNKCNVNLDDVEVSWEQLEYLIEKRPCRFEKAISS